VAQRLQFKNSWNINCFVVSVSLRNSQIIIYFCETKIKGIKKTLKILGFSFGGLILFLGVLFVLIQTSMIQNVISKAIVSELSQKLHTKVTVGKIEYEFFDDISIHDLYVQDLQNDTLLFVNQADAKFKFWKFFTGKIIFTSVDLNQLYGNLIIDKKGHSNLDFVIEAFKTPQKKDTTQITYRINHFRLKNCSFNYTNFKELLPTPKNIFNGNKLNIRNINADVSLNLLKEDSFNIRVLKFSAEEQSGLILTDFKTQIFGSRKGIKIPQIELRLPNSNVNLVDVQLKYDSLADLQHFANKVRWDAPIKLSSIAFSDLKAFVPEFENIKGAATLKGLITGRLKNMRFEKMEINYGNSFLLKADLDVNGLPDLREAFIYGKINDLRFQKNELQDFISDLTRKPFILPNELNQLGPIRYKGNITGFLNNLVLYGNLTTDVGNISTDFSLKFENQLKDLAYNGTIKSENLKLGKLLSDKKLGNVSFSFNTKGIKHENASLQGTIEADITDFQLNNYTYRDIQFGGKYDGKGFDGTVDLQDKNIDAHFAGKIDLTQKLPIFDFSLAVNNTNLNALKIIDKYPGATLSFNGKTNIVGNSFDNINGFVRFENIKFNNLNKTLNVDQIQIVSRTEIDKTNLSVNSDFINGSLSGNFKYRTLGQTINKIVQNYLPSLAVLDKKVVEKTSNHINIDLKISNTKDISDVLVLPYSLEGESTINGFIDEKSNKIDISGNIPMLKSNKQQIENIALHIENPKQQLQFTSRAQLQTKDEMLQVFLKATAAKDSVGTQIGWQNTQQITNAGEILAVARLRNDNGNIAAQLNIRPTQIIISDSTWNIHSCRIDFNADSTIQIRNFNFDNNRQFIHINGIASKSKTDSVSVSLKDVDLEFVMGLLKLKGISLGGIVTGKATLLGALNQPIFEAKIKVKDFKLNHKVVGDANVFSNWDKENNLLLARGFFTGSKNDTIVVASGFYNPRNDTIDIGFDARKFSLEFLSYYFDPVAKDFKGFAKGKIRMFGPLKHGVSFEGDAFVSQCQATVKVLKTTYYIDDSVHLTKKTIEFRNIKAYDQERNAAFLNGKLTHNGLFQHMKFDVNILGQNILALNTRSEDNEYFFGKAYANGAVHIFGDEKEANIVVNAVSQPNTKCYIQMGGASKASDNSFINFVNKRIYSKKDSILARKTPASDMNVKVDLKIDVNQNADMELIVDPKAGDMITGKGNGNLRVEFDSFSDIKLYGTYTIDNGYYLFTLQNLFRKEFKIDQGSTLAWTGNPYNAQVNIRALYPLTASLKDLFDPSTLALTTTRTSIPVNCVLKLTDNIMKPTVKFDIDLPQSDEGVKQRVRNIINTDEMLNRQILYLLVFNKFYMPDYMNASATANIGSSEAISFATSTASAQVNNWVSQLTKSNNLSFGFDYRQSDNVSSDLQTQVFYQPNNRLIINGNFGYRFDNLSNSTNKLINDVDIQYLLTESGKFRFKVYNHTIDRYQLSKAQNTEGLGFIYKEDFNSFNEIVNYYWNLITGKKKKTNEKIPAKNK
jgi:hypothetical protein